MGYSGVVIYQSVGFGRRRRGWGSIYRLRVRDAEMNGVNKLKNRQRVRTQGR
jgi:hypothetical protein